MDLAWACEWIHRTFATRLVPSVARQRCSTRLAYRDEASIGDRRLVVEFAEAGFAEQRFHLASRVTFSLGDVHQQGGVFRDGQGAGFVGVQMGIVHNQSSA